MHKHWGLRTRTVREACGLHWTWLALVGMILLPVLAALAQTPRSAAIEPFEKMNANLVRVIDLHLEQAGKPSQWEPARAAWPDPQAPAKEIHGSGNIFAGISREHLENARRRFLALGVDAPRIFAQEGVPVELLRVAAVESNFDPRAISSKGARGLWQLMPETAARFGLRVDKQIDERAHSVRSTRAAAQYLRELYDRFGNWALALAAYNAGEVRVATAIRLAGTRDFWQLSGRGLLPEETRRYVPAVLAGAAPK